MSDDSRSHDLSHTTQGELPFAIVSGEPVSKPPEDLYIPPNALEVFLEMFEGPLDLLLYLIKRQNLDILNIPIAQITRQYMEYVEMMHLLKLDLAAEYLLMAAMLAEIKSRMLLPRHETVEEEDDPRAELIRRLQEYEQFKKAAENLDQLPRQERDIWPVSPEAVFDQREKPLPDIQLKDLLLAFQDVLKRVDMNTHHQIQRHTISIRSRMTHVLEQLQLNAFVNFRDLFTLEEGKQGVVVTFMAILELLKDKVIDLVQAESYTDIYLKPVTASLDNDF